MSPMSLEIKSFSGADARPFLDDVARLRIAVFRDFPYLYDGDPDYERGFRFDDPDVGIAWPKGVDPLVSQRDRDAPLLRDIRATLPF